MNSLYPLLVAASTLAPSAMAQPWMERLERHPSPDATLSFVDVTDDGVVLGQYRFQFQTILVDTGFFWTRSSSLQLIGSATRWNAACLSADAMVAFGSSIPTGAVISFLSGSAGTATSSVTGQPLAASASGAEAYGFFAGALKTPMVFLRQNPDGSVHLPVPAIGGSQTRDVVATAAKDDGVLVYGNADFIRTSDNAPYSRAVSWNRAQSPATLTLIPLAFGNTSTVLNAISSDAQWGAGAAWNGVSLHRPWLFVASAQAWAPLPLVNDDVSGDAIDISASGATLIGNTRGPVGQTDRGRVWCNALEFSGRSIESLLASRGLDISLWTGLSLRHISPDGQYLIGDGLYEGVEHSWAAFVGRTCCPSDINDDGVVDLVDYFDFFNCFDVEGPCADVDSTPGVNLDDFFAFFNAFDAGC